MAYVVPSSLNVDKLEAAVPNIVLQSPEPLEVFLYYKTDEESGEQRSLYSFKLPIRHRECPMEYVYEENIGYETWVEMVEEAKDIIEAAETTTQKAEEAKQSATQADTSAKAAQKAEQDAQAHETSAKDAQAKAEQARDDAKASQADVLASKNAAEKSAGEALTSQQAAKDSENNARASADKAAQSLTDAKAAQTAAEKARDEAVGAKDTAVESSQSAQKSAETAKQYSGNPPKIGDNNNWWIWNATTSSYEDSGYPSVLTYNKVYTSLTKMQADTKQPLNTLAVIQTSVEEEDNAKLYIWKGTEWVYLTDLSGFTGNGIKSVKRTSGDGSAGTLDTYTITFTDDSTTTFEVYNGADGTGQFSVTDDSNGNVTVSFT